MIKAFVLVLVFVSSISNAQVNEPADKLARLYSLDSSAQMRRLVEQGLPNAPEKLTIEFSSRLSDAVREYYSGEYKKRLTVGELTQLVEALTSSAGQKLRAINTEFAFSMATDPSLLRRFVSIACESTSRSVPIEQMAQLNSTFCR